MQTSQISYSFHSLFDKVHEIKIQFVFVFAIIIRQKIGHFGPKIAVFQIGSRYIRSIWSRKCPRSIIGCNWCYTISK